MKPRIALFAHLVLAVATIPVNAKPYLPRDDSEVLETLPRELLASRGELDELRRLLVIDPQNLPVATKVATRYVRLGKQESDPRFYGYARAALVPWWDEENPPPEVLRLRAKLQESDHDYAAAVADLKRLLEKEPRDVQAWIELANIFRVQGNYAESCQACDALSAFAGSAHSVYCRVPLPVYT